MPDITSPRLNLRRFTESDAPFALALLNDPGWLQFIGDKGVRTLEDARAYLRDGPITMYARFSLGRGTAAICLGDYWGVIAPDSASSKSGPDEDRG